MRTVGVSGKEEVKEMHNPSNGPDHSQQIKISRDKIMIGIWCFTTDDKRKQINANLNGR